MDESEFRSSNLNRIFNLSAVVVLGCSLSCAAAAATASNNGHGQNGRAVAEIRSLACAIYKADDTRLLQSRYDCAPANGPSWVVAQEERGIVVQPLRRPTDQPPIGAQPQSPGSQSPALQTHPTIKLEQRPPQLFEVSVPIRIATLNGQRDLLAGLTPHVPFQIVDKNEHPDLVWDPDKRELTSGGEVIARSIGRNELPGCIDRAAISRWLEVQYSGPKQAMQVLSKERIHHKSSNIEIVIDGLLNKSLVLVNVAADGTMQFLYPNDSDPLTMTEDAYSITLKVGEPLGADQIIAVISSHRMLDLIRALKRIDSRRDPTQVVDAILHFGPADFAIGSTQTLSAP
jgi:hypothetical protein